MHKGEILHQRLWLIFLLLLHQLKPTYEQVGNAAVIENSNQDSRWMSVPLGANNHTLGQPNQMMLLEGISMFWPPTRLAKHNWQQTKRYSCQLVILMKTETKNLPACSQPWSYPKNTTNRSVICECGSALERIVTMHKWNSVTITSS